LQVQKVSAGDDCIFGGDVAVREQQHGYLRYSYVPTAPTDISVPSKNGNPGKRTPRRFRCQPDLVDSENKRRNGLPDHAEDKQPLIRPQLRFLSTTYGQPDYCQLPIEPVEAPDLALRAITQGAESESEMGVFHNEYFPQRRSRLQQQLTDFTPANMQSAVLFADEL
jgi:hypothetical protein